MNPAAVRDRLLLLRSALDALAALGDDAPNVERLRASLQALDPALSDGTFDPAAFTAEGLPHPDWLRRPAVRREALLVQDEAEVSDDVILRATQVDAELAQRLIAERTFHRFLRRHPMFPAEPGVLELPDGPWWTWDHVLEDGRWGRIRVRGDVARRPQPGDAWFLLALDDLDAEVGYDGVRRCLVGPVWRDTTGEDAGLFAVREATGEAPVRRLAVDRMRAEDVPAGHVIVPFARPD